MPRAIRFEIAAAQPSVMFEFYRHLFGWDYQRVGEQDYWMISGGEGPGVDGGMVRRQEGAPGVIVTYSVGSVDQCLARIVQLGGAVFMPKVAIPGTGYMAYCVDPEGNPFGIMQLDPTAS